MEMAIQRENFGVNTRKGRDQKGYIEAVALEMHRIWYMQIRWEKSITR